MQKQRIIEEFLHSALSAKEIMSFYLVNGICLRGKIIRFDSETIVIEGPEGVEQAILLQAVSTICSHKISTGNNANNFKSTGSNFNFN